MMCNETEQTIEHSHDHSPVYPICFGVYEHSYVVAQGMSGLTGERSRMRLVEILDRSGVWMEKC